MGNGRLTARQMDFARLVADGMTDNEAVLKAGYSPISKYNTLMKLRENSRVQAQIKYYQKCDSDDEVADKLARERFWTMIMNDPSQPATVRLKASEHLGKAQGDFVNVSKVESTNSQRVVYVPQSSPKEWEEYWEKNFEG